MDNICVRVWVGHRACVEATGHLGAVVLSFFLLCGFQNGSQMWKAPLPAEPSCHLRLCILGDLTEF